MMSTYSEAVTFIVRALGWLLPRSGGYPIGYMKMAQELKLISENVTLDFNSIDIRAEVTDIIFKSLFADTLERVAPEYYDQFDTYHYWTAPCPLENYHDLYYEYGYAVRDKDGIIINDKKFSGEVYQNPDFDKGKVLCIYKKDEINSIVICVET